MGNITQQHLREELSFEAGKGGKASRLFHCSIQFQNSVHFAAFTVIPEVPVVQRGFTVPEGIIDQHGDAVQPPLQELVFDLGEPGLVRRTSAAPSSPRPWTGRRSGCSPGGPPARTEPGRARRHIGGR